ncbi:MAG: hypothetical protein LBT37_04115 [Lactobacillaceae bacterium]|jgi:hypothetical protein|nr:hypothetical protein [Lactobacillaceae bacterium]
MARLQKFIELYRYDTKIQVGEFASFKDEDGVYRDRFKPNFEIWAAPYSVLYHEMVNNSGPNQQEDQVYAVSELGMVKLNMLVLIDEVQYDVVRVSPWADKRDPRGYDLITLSRGNGINRSYRNAGGT